MLRKGLATQFDKQLKYNNVAVLSKGGPNGSIDGILDLKTKTIIKAPYVNTMLDLPDPIIASNNGKEMIVRNPANNTKGYAPVKVYCMNNLWYKKSGVCLLKTNAPRRKFTLPPKAWDDAGFTLASANGGLETKITAAAGALHSLTTALQITAGDTSVNITGSTGTGTVDWTPGFWKITAVTDGGSDITINHPYYAGLKTPVMSVIGDEIELARIIVPPLSNYGGVEVFALFKNVGLLEHRMKIRYGVSGTTIAASTELLSANDTASSPITMRAGIQNVNGTIVNIGLGGSGDQDGWGLAGAGAGASYPVMGVSNGSSFSDILITATSNATNEITMELAAYRSTWW